jgi:hypothetical protein
VGGGSSSNLSGGLLLAFPSGIAMIGLGYSLWLAARTETTTLPTAVDTPRLTAAGAE